MRCWRFAYFSLLLLLSFSFVSAGFASDFLESITGKVAQGEGQNYSCLLDVDRDGNVSAATDATYIFRYLLGLQAIVPEDFRELNSLIISDEDMANNIELISDDLLDVDRDGNVLASTDGVYLYRYFLGLSIIVPEDFRELDPLIISDEEITRNIKNISLVGQSGECIFGELVEICNNGVDDTYDVQRGLLDPLIDCEDPACFDSEFCVEEETPIEPVCGNGVIEFGEVCDDGNTDSGDGCDELCQVEIFTEPVCGNGILEEGEECDGALVGNATCVAFGFDSGTLTCLDTCSYSTGDCVHEEIPIDPVEPVCGNGILEEGEQCDDGNLEDGDGCESSCVPTPEPSCELLLAYWSVGEAVEGSVVTLIVEGTSACDGDQISFVVEEKDYFGDDSVLHSPDTATFFDGKAYASWVVEWQCDFMGLCIYGVPEYGFEAFLASQPSLSIASSGKLKALEASPTCGNSLVQDDEQCDDGNLEDGDGCSAHCSLEICGNGIIDFEEACDDGNADSGDGCDSSCAVELITPTYIDCSTGRVGEYICIDSVVARQGEELEIPVRISINEDKFIEAALITVGFDSSVANGVNAKFTRGPLAQDFASEYNNFSSSAQFSLASSRGTVSNQGVLVVLHLVAGSVGEGELEIERFQFNEDPLAQGLSIAQGGRITIV